MEALTELRATQVRATGLAAGVVGSLVDISKWAVIGGLLSAVATAVVGVGSRDPFVAAAAGVVFASATTAVALLPLRDRAFRAAAELVFDHARHERAEWKQETGTAMPRGIKAARHWLADHPKAQGRASLLVALGRLTEADEAIAAVRP